MRYLLNSVAVLVAFVLAAQLTAPLVDLVGFWDISTPEGKRLLVFNLLFYALVIAAFLVIRVTVKRGRMSIPRQVDEIGGAIFGLLYVVAHHLLRVRDPRLVLHRWRADRWMGARPVRGTRGFGDRRLLPQRDSPGGRLPGPSVRPERGRRVHPTAMTRAAADPSTAPPRAWFDRHATALAPDLLGVPHRARRHRGHGRRQDRGGRGVPRPRGPGGALVAGQDAAQRRHVRATGPPVRLSHLRAAPLPQRRGRTRVEARGGARPRASSSTRESTSPDVGAAPRSRSVGLAPAQGTSVAPSGSTGDSTAVTCWTDRSGSSHVVPDPPRIRTRAPRRSRLRRRVGEPPMALLDRR